MTDYYISPLGSDTTALGTQANPWASFTKAFTSAAAGDNVYAANGTYMENTAGSGYWQITKNVANWITVQPTSGTTGSVLITGTTGTVGNTEFSGACGYLRFKYLTFGTKAGTRNALRTNTNAAIANIDFQNCTFTGEPTASTYGVIHGSSSNLNMTAITFTDCIVSATGGSGRAVYFQGVGNPTLGLTFTRCKFSSVPNNVCHFTMTTGNTTVNFYDCEVSPITGYGLFANGGTYNFMRGYVFASASCDHGLSFGTDADSGGAPTTATVVGTVIDMRANAATHSLLLGSGCSNSVVDGVRINMTTAGYAIVMKESNANEIKNCVLDGYASNSTLYFKATTTSNVHDNLITSYVTDKPAVQVYPGGTGRESGGCILKNNIIKAYGNAHIFGWTTGGDAGTNICNGNLYRLYGAAAWGTVLTTSAVSSLDELRLSWSTGITDNDSYSHILPDTPISSGRRVR